MSSSFDPEGLLLKSKLFINRVFDSGREFEEQAFWACTALELLGKSALAGVSPLLIANPTDDGKSILAATGLIQDASAASVPAKAVWSRCQRIFKPFSESEAKVLSFARNEYVHAAGIGFDALPAHAWWPRFWSQVVILLNHMNLDIDDYVDSGHVEAVNVALTAHKQRLKQQLEARIGRARNMLSQAQAGTLSTRQLKEWESKLVYASPYSYSVVCPACEFEATIYGDDVVETDVSYGFDRWGEPDIQVTLTVAPTALVCDQCRLHLGDYELLVEAGLDGDFDVEGSGDDIDYEAEYNNE